MMTKGFQRPALNYMQVKEQSERMEHCRAEARAALAAFRECRSQLWQAARRLGASRSALRNATREYWRMHGVYLRECLGSSARGARRLFVKAND